MRCQTLITCAHLQRAVDGCSRDVYVWDLVVSKGYRDLTKGVQAWLLSVTEPVQGHKDSGTVIWPSLAQLNKRAQ
ncbi:unnamed protein product [Schistosoma margrebowiei]|uniref:Uncharacterized protein n=1 Tax=Schistosoma margrebowiei TaxID=48269 RepID=A0A183LFC9_9TREM|nr:unnamed protein product [Schistosoma margrebowiei]